MDYSNNPTEYDESDTDLTHVDVSLLLLEFEDRRHMIGGSDDGQLRIWTQTNIRYGDTCLVYPAHAQWSINCLCLLDNLNQLATASNDGTLKIWDITDINNSEINLRVYCRNTQKNKNNTY